MVFGPSCALITKWHQGDDRKWGRRTWSIELPQLTPRHQYFFCRYNIFHGCQWTACRLGLSFWIKATLRLKAVMVKLRFRIREWICTHCLQKPCKSTALTANPNIICNKCIAFLSKRSNIWWEHLCGFLSEALPVRLPQVSDPWWMVGEKRKQQLQSRSVVAMSCHRGQKR